MSKTRLEGELAERYTPVQHGSAFRDKIMAKPGMKAAYGPLAGEQASLDAVLIARAEIGST